VAIDIPATARKITRTLLAVQGLGQAAVVALFPIMAIVGAKLGGRPDWAGVPAMCYQLGQASAAYGWGYAMDPLGRRGMLMLGALAGAAGALISTAAVVSASLWSFLLGSTLVGVAISAVQLSRFVAAEVHQASERARAISTVVVGGTLGAIVGPLIAGPMSRIAARRTAGSGCVKVSPRSTAMNPEAKPAIARPCRLVNARRCSGSGSSSARGMTSIAS